MPAARGGDVEAAVREAWPFKPDGDASERLAALRFVEGAGEARRMGHMRRFGLVDEARRRSRAVDGNSRERDFVVEKAWRSNRACEATEKPGPSGASSSPESASKGPGRRLRHLPLMSATVVLYGARLSNPLAIVGVVLRSWKCKVDRAVDVDPATCRLTRTVLGQQGGHVWISTWHAMCAPVQAPLTRGTSKTFYFANLLIYMKSTLTTLKYKFDII